MVSRQLLFLRYRFDVRVLEYFQRSNSAVYDNVTCILTLFFTFAKIRARRSKRVVVRGIFKWFLAENASIYHGIVQAPRKGMQVIHPRDGLFISFLCFRVPFASAVRECRSRFFGQSKGGTTDVRFFFVFFVFAERCILAWSVMNDHEIVIALAVGYV